MQLNDTRGWLPLWVEASDFEDLMLQYQPREHGSYEEYLQEQWGELSLDDAVVPQVATGEVADQRIGTITADDD